VARFLLISTVDPIIAPILLLILCALVFFIGLTIGLSCRPKDSLPTGATSWGDGLTPRELQELRSGWTKQVQATRAKFDAKTLTPPVEIVKPADVPQKLKKVKQAEEKVIRVVVKDGKSFKIVSRNGQEVSIPLTD